jgi:hypothetical protein
MNGNFGSFIECRFQQGRLHMRTRYLWINVDPILISETQIRRADVLKWQGNGSGENEGLTSAELRQKEKFSQE